jgi:hypothetical protein
VPLHVRLLPVPVYELQQTIHETKVMVRITRMLSMISLLSPHCEKKALKKWSIGFHSLFLVDTWVFLDQRFPDFSLQVEIMSRPSSFAIFVLCNWPRSTLQLSDRVFSFKWWRVYMRTHVSDDPDHEL